MGVFMSLFPQNALSANGDDKWLLDVMESSYNEAISINQVYWSEGDLDSRFEAGDQSALNEHYSHLPVDQRKQFSFNRIRRIKNMISGHQRKHRKSMVVQPIENGDEYTADQFTKIFMWLNKQENVSETISDAFEGALITGLNLLHVWMDYRSDPINGSIRVNSCAYNSFLIDPFFRKSDLSDCNYLWKRSHLTRAECISLLPEHEEEIMSLSTSNKDGKFNHLPENFAMKENGLFTHDEFYYRTYRKQKKLVDTQTGQTLEYEFEDNAKLKAYLKAFPQIDVVDAMIPTVNLGIVIQGRVFYNDREPLGLDEYPFVPVFADYRPDIPSYHLRLQGIVRGLRDAQFLYNRRKIIELDMLESQLNGGLIVKSGALVDPNSAYQTGQGRVLFLKKGAEITDVQQIPPPQVPPSTIELSRLLSEEMQQISGVSDELLGSATDDKAGVLSMLRQGASLTTLEGLFDKLDQAQRLLGRRILKLIQNNFTPAKVQNIVDAEPSPQFYNKFFGKYDCVIIGGMNTDTQRQMAIAQALQLKQAGVNIPDEFFIENMAIQNKTEIKQQIQQQQQQQQQAEQARQQVEMQELQSRSNLADARAEADRGLGAERYSRIWENQALAGERIAEAEKDRMAGVLDLVKALKEIDNIDINQVQTLLNLSQLLKTQEAEQEKAMTQNTQSVEPQARRSSLGLQDQKVPGQDVPVGS